MKSKSYRVNFKKNPRTDERAVETVVLPECVPPHAINRAICATLVACMGYEFASDPIMVTSPITIHAVECGIPDDVKCNESIDILV